MSRSLAGLLALLILCTFAPRAYSQGSRALQTERVAELLIDTGTVSSTHSLVSDLIYDPVQITSVDYAASGAGMSGPLLTFNYSNSPSGPFVAGVGSGFDNTVTFANTPTSGAPVTLYPFKYAKATMSTSGVAFSLTRCTMARNRITGRTRPVALQEFPAEVKPFAGLVVGATTTSSLFPATPNPSLAPWDIMSIFMDTTGGSGETRTVNFCYSNSKTGPFVAWEDPHAVGYLNSTASTALTMAKTVTLHPALYYQESVTKAAGANMTILHLIHLTHTQVVK